MEIIIVILVLFVIFYFHQSYTQQQPPIYLNMNMRDMCQKADRNIDDDIKNDILKMQKENEKKLDDCRKKYIDEKKRGDRLYLKYGDPEPNSIDFLYYGNDNSPLYGDDKLTYRMYAMSQKNKQALVNRAMWNKNSILPYFEEELRNHADSVWWDDDTLEGEF
jgi:hypothetical protein